jgi:hypothetical protein
MVRLLEGFQRNSGFVDILAQERPKMTWVQRAAAGVDAKHFQAALVAKGGALTPLHTLRPSVAKTADGLFSPVSEKSAGTKPPGG